MIWQELMGVTGLEVDTSLEGQAVRVRVCPNTGSYVLLNASTQSTMKMSAGAARHLADCLYAAANQIDPEEPEEEIRAAIAKHIPEELQNKRIEDLEKEIAGLKEQLRWARS